ncbi:MAG: hypothetical protein PHE84_05770 [bacterium]|nr:hypothetical protein [bacterium]
MQNSHFSEDLQEFIRLLAKFKVAYVIVGGEAVIYHGYARLTGDVDFFYESSPENAKRLYDALDEFWNGKIPSVGSPREFIKVGIIFQFGSPPNRIDLINTIEGVTFKEAWDNKIKEKIIIKGKTYPVFYIGIKELIKNKKALGRYKDLDDLRYLKSKKRS